MEKAFSSFLLIVLLLLHYVMASPGRTQTNITTDQLTLLSLKSQIISDPFHFLDESWSPATFVCHWVGVTCGSRHQRVKSLNISNMALAGRIPREFGNLRFLVSLDLGSNNFHGNLPQEMARLHQLKFLRLSVNNFRGKYNQLTGSIPFTIFKISRIKVIAFTGNTLSGHLPNGLCNAFNELDGPIHSEIGRLSNLQILDLGTNHFTGEIPKEIRNLVELDELDLSFNSFSGLLDMEIFNISGLRIIDLSLNNLSGRLPPNIGSILPNIEGLFLGALTNLVGTIPHSISNCSKLTILELANNKLPGLIPNSLGCLTHLQILNLVANNLTSESLLSFLTSLTNCRNLTYLDISFNPLNDMLPASTGNLSPSLRTFFAMCCKIQGRIPDEVGNVSSLLDLRLSGNNLVGSIPATIGNLTKLQLFHLTNNKLTGFIGDHICKLQHLGNIYFGQNQLSGSLPNCLGNITSLREIHLGSNKLSSNTPPSLGNLQDLVVLDLLSNNMVGSLPKEIGNLKAVTKMNLSMNQFSNENPREIGGLQNLAYRRGKRASQQADSLSAITSERISYYELLQATDALSECNLIGSGSFSSVYKCVLRSGTAIAVKVFNLQLDAAFKSFYMECEVLRAFAIGIS
ncbi:LRR receptor-like serine/threonine-protein kinase EFR [Capsicum annuum]|uniref:LRR receptor-like serine/threonine-protein kinase EFR n=1 Tax=Capsicum annuum TaxID=4072 RepID=UPI001FB13A73|nr:LRR receptor-like serine/threonine-protein kinase EFR [Capsicum annuum]